VVGLAQGIAALKAFEAEEGGIEAHAIALESLLAECFPALERENPLSP
jgi:hypothetical protein